MIRGTIPFDVQEDAMSKKILAALILLLVLAPAGCRRLHEAVPVHAVPAQVPEPFQMIYRELDAEFHRQLPLVPLPWEQKASRTAFGVELLAANSHRGEALLSQPALEASAFVLDRLKALNVRCVSLSLQYPVLTRAYPRTPEYRAFYRSLAAEIRRRGLAIVAEMGSAFREPEFSQIGVDYRGLSRERFSAGLREMAEAIIADIRPDYLTLLSEPDTQTRNTGLAFSPAEFAATVKHVARGLERPGIRIGAGAGSWAALEYFKALAELPELDYLDLHIYPIQHGFAAERVFKAADIARTHGKGIAIGEAWLYKVWGREFNRISPLEAFGRDAYSFWQPLDEHFIERVVDVARRIDAEFCSFFWMKYLYGYVDYNADTRQLKPAELMSLSDRVAHENIRKGVLSATGEKFVQLIKP
jgi:hypothetical protein